MKFKNPLEVNGDDTFGTAFVKKMTDGYVKGALAAGAGLGILAVVVRKISKKSKNSKKKVEKTKDKDVDKKIEEKVVKLKNQSKAQ
jgi:hypothetical protein